MNSNPKSLHKRAQQLFQANQLPEALELYRKLCRLNDRDIQALHMIGAISGMTGDYATAKSSCEKVIALDPTKHGPYLNLANILVATGDFKGAKQRFSQALQLKPEDSQTLTNLANLYLQQGQPETAENHLQRAIRANPGNPEAYNNLGNLYRDMARPVDAVACFTKALQIKPDYTDALCNLGATYSDQLEFKAAENCYARALQLNPGYPPALRNLGDLYQSTGEFEKARSRYEQALDSFPADTGARTALATLEERCGRDKEALALLLPLIESRQNTPDAALTYSRLLRKQGDYTTGIQLLSEFLTRPVSLDKAIDIHFELGELHDRSGQYDRAFQHFKAGNDQDAARRSSPGCFSDLEYMQNHFTRERISSLPVSSCESEQPVFIVGMPRTGTSLVEQILASHPLVYAGGEREDIFKIVHSLTESTGERRRMPDAFESLTSSKLNEIAAEHLEQISRLSGGKKRFTDKTPLHGIHLGLISQLFPRSRILICNRNPLDSCLSIYFNRFNAYHGYACRLDSLGSFYREYYALMEHWKETLDLNMLPVQYEDLVRDPETYIRKIISFCGLDWDNNCLLFHENKRVVNTPSYNQVRKPMYTDSVNRWSNYEKYLDPLRKTLDK